MLPLIFLAVFYKEVNESITGAIEENISCDNLILEVNSSKYANNVSINDVMRCITLSAFEISTGDETSYFASLKKVSVKPSHITIVMVLF